MDSIKLATEKIGGNITATVEAELSTAYTAMTGTGIRITSEKENVLEISLMR